MSILKSQLFRSFTTMSQKPSIPKGTRDFGPDKMAKRNLIFDTIRSVFQKYGFMPLETPTMENLSVLTGKYGDEGDQLLFKVLNSGDFMSKVKEEDGKDSQNLLRKISEKGMRYDLTVPFARYVVMNQHEIAFPFKRYQMQPVWRADRPQKGRYREFYQCDADVVGTDSLLCECEIILMINEVFEKLGIEDYHIKVNHRQVLSGIAKTIGAEGNERDFFVAIDKLDKVGPEGVQKELLQKGFSESSLEVLLPLLNMEGSIEDKIAQLKRTFTSNQVSAEGLEALETVLAMLSSFALAEHHVEFDQNLARGLSYYTGMIFEVKVKGVAIGSVSGGGRYDDLTGIFGLKNISGVGFSFGVDRIYDVMEELNLFPETVVTTSQVLIVHHDLPAQEYGMPILAQMRRSGISAELYPDVSKFKKQMTYANKKAIPHVIVIGDEEINTGLLTLKDMRTGHQEQLSLQDICQKLTLRGHTDTKDMKS